MHTDTRRAALTLHALPTADREWILSRLDPQQRLAVDAQLGELQALGIVADERLVHDALRAAERETPPAWRASLRRCDAASVHAALQAEPAALIARVLARGPWPWEPALLDALSPTRRSHVMRLRAGSAACAHLDDALLAELARRCADSAAVPVAVAVEAAPSKAATWLRRWRRAR